MDIHVDIQGFLEIHAWICYGFSDQGISISYEAFCFSPSMRFLISNIISISPGRILGHRNPTLNKI